MAIIKEIWKDIKGFEGIYEISSLGRIRSKDRYVYYKTGKKAFKKGEFKIPTLGKRGYYVVNLWLNNKVKLYYLHQLIAQAFIPNPYNKMYVDHINIDKTDNRIENLRWVTHKENMNNENTRKKMSNTHKILCSKKEKAA